MVTLIVEKIAIFRALGEVWILHWTSWSGQKPYHETHDFLMLGSDHA